MKKYLFGPPLLLAGLFANASHAYAMCPVCTVAVAGGIGLTRWIGLDDTIAGVWIGALVISSATWTVNWLLKKKIEFPLSNLILSALYYVIIMGPLYWKDIVGHPLNVILGIDKLLFGSLIGVAIFTLSVILHNYLKKRNGGKSYFNFQRVVIPIASLIAASVVMFFATK